MEFKLKTFEELTTYELYDLLRLRTNVFVVEQTCPYPELDGKDLKCHHLLGYYEGKLVAYSRLIPPGISYQDASIGRVCVDQEYRRLNLGRELMHQAITTLTTHLNYPTIRISGQAYLKAFYESFGFQCVSDVYLEDDIPHIEMLYGGNDEK